MSRWLKVVAWIAGGLVGLLVVGVLALAIGVWVASDPKPVGTSGPEAEQLAESLMDSVDHEAWERTGAVAWSMGGIRDHLWDRTRHLDRYHSGDLTVWIDLDTHQGRAEQGGTEQEGGGEAELGPDDLRGFVGRSDFVVLLGTGDVDTEDEGLRKSAEAEEQGPHRFARGQSRHVAADHPKDLHLFVSSFVSALGTSQKLIPEYNDRNKASRQIQPPDSPQQSTKEKCPCLEEHN